MSYRLRTGRHLLLASTLALVALAAVAVAPASAQPARPNIVLVLTDDQRWDSLRRMPTVQRELVGKGVTFENAFAVNPLCCPSRASILTGLHSHSTRVYTNAGPLGGWEAFDDSSTVATWLEGSGYRTGYVGKYLNGYSGPDVPPGWDRWFGYEKGFYGYTVSDDGVWRVFGLAPDDYATDVFTREAVAFVESGGTQPFFLVYAPFAPHSPAPPALRHTDAMPNLKVFRPPSYDEADGRDKPQWVRRTKRLSAAKRAEMDELGKKMHKSLLAVDDGVAALLDALGRTGRLANTVVVYASDNGLLWGEHRQVNIKVAAYEESIRIPLVVRWDALGLAPRRERRLATNLDLAPMFAEVARAARPRVEGRSLLRLVAGGSASWRDRILLEHMQGGGNRGSDRVPTYCGVRTDRWKYVVYETREEELYDLARDRHEMRNLVDRPALRGRLLALRRDVRRLCSPPPPGLSLAWHCTHETSASARVAVGTGRGDTLCGRGRADTLHGLGGDDFLRARAGHDRLYGGLGHDRLDGDGGRDLLSGAKGRDVLTGGPGRDRIFGGRGDDRVFAIDGLVDTISCGPGRDVVRADGRDVVARDCEAVTFPPARPAPRL